MENLLFLSLFFLYFNVHSQSCYPIKVGLQVNTPYPNKLSEYGNKVKVTLRNYNNFQHSVFLKLKFTNDKGVFVITNSSS